MNVRFATIQDESAVLSLLDELISEVNRLSGKLPKFTDGQEKRSKIYKELLNNSDVKIFVAEKGSQIVGVADLHIVPVMRRGYFQGHVEDFVIKENERGKGIGVTLINSIKDYCKKEGIKVIKLSSGLELTRAHKFYINNGGIFTEKLFRFDL
ncbi:MAG: GNAT family N-acetyltransferase [bacterium]